MKKYLKRTFVAVASTILVLTTTSCNHYLDVAISTGQSEEYIFEDYTRALRYLDQLYYGMLPTWAGNGKFSGHGMMESATDMSEYSASYGVTNQSFNVGDWTNSSAANEIQIWSTCYKNIRKAWKMLDHVNDFSNEPFGRKETMKGECHFMLAYNYFELYRRYGGVPLVKSVLGLETDNQIPRATEDEVLEYILSELDLAQTLLPEEWNKSQYGRADWCWIKALRSRVLLYAASPLHNPDKDVEKWKAAADAAKDCIQYCESTGRHTLYPDYQRIFYGEYPDKVKEIIMFARNCGSSVSFTSSLINYEQATPGEGFEGQASNGPSQNLVDRYPVIVYDGEGNAIGCEDFDWNNPDHVKNMYKNRDPRFYYTILYNDAHWIKRNIETWFDGSGYGKDRDPKNEVFTKTGYYLRKYWPVACQWKNVPGSQILYGFYIRLAEIYLNYAEAMNEAYGPDEANGYLTALEAANKLRERLVLPPTDSIPNKTSDPHYYVRVERIGTGNGIYGNPDLPVLRNGVPGIKLTGMYNGVALSPKDEARERIHNERAIELAFEDQYFYDILRWKEGPQHIGNIVYGVNVQRKVDPVTQEVVYDYSRTKVDERVFQERMYHYPIPRTEVYNLGTEQNPGW